MLLPDLGARQVRKGHEASRGRRRKPLPFQQALFLPHCAF